MSFKSNILDLNNNIKYILTTQQNIGAPDTTNYGAQLFYYLLMLSIVLALAFYTTKFISKTKLKGFASKNINVMEMVSVGIGISLAIIKIGEQFFLVSISKENVRLLSEIDGSQLQFTSDKNERKYDFSEYFKKYLKDDKGKDNDEKIL